MMLDLLRTRALQGLAIVGLLACVGAVSYGAGHRHATAAAKAHADAEALKAERAARAAEARAWAEGEQVAATLRTEVSALLAHQSTLEKRLQDARSVLVVRAPAVARGAFAGPDAGADAGAVAGRGTDAGGLVGNGLGAVQAMAAPAGPLGDDPARAVPGAAGPGVRLSLAAVSLWNSALAGRDLDALACRADAPLEPACAADAGIDLIELFGNQRINAGLCAADRARLDALIDLIERLQAPTP